MFEDGVADAIDYVLGDDSLPSIHDDLMRGGATVAVGSCSECDGTIYDNDDEVVCGNCSLVIGSDTARGSGPSPWEHFQENRPTYYNSNKQRCPGGFPDAYDWVEREDIDRPVKKIDPETFYR